MATTLILQQVQVDLEQLHQILGMLLLDRGLKLLVGETASIKSLPKKTADKIISYLSYDSSKRYRCVFKKRPECDFDLCEKCFNHGLGNVSKG
jgi:hypothetical protein